MKECLEVWSKTINAYKETISDESFNDLFLAVNDIFKVENNTIWITVPSTFARYRIEKFHLSNINEISKSFSNYSFKFIEKTTADEEKESENDNKLVNTTKEDVDKSLNKRKLMNEYTFSNFVTGESNRFAFLSSMKVAEDKETVWNPLYIFGDVGLGKTHLMSAIGNYMLDNNKDLNIVYTTSQQYAQDYYLSTSQRSREKIEAFYNYYREADVLLVDDVQFLDKKMATQEEFFKLFEYLYQNNKQMVITSDCPANQLKNIMPRLKSRFGFGLSVDIQTPSKELRLDILQKKVPYMISNPSDVPTEALEVIAETFITNIRDLEGALRRYITYCVTLDIPFTVDNVYLALECLIPESVATVSKEKSNVKKIKDVKGTVSDYYKIPVKDIESASRKQNITFARQMSIYLIRTKYNLPLKRIGEFFGNRDHATISHSYDKILALTKSDPSVNQDVEILLKIINNF